jgi:hypothetical protein
MQKGTARQDLAGRFLHGLFAVISVSLRVEEQASPPVLAPASAAEDEAAVAVSPRASAATQAWTGPRAWAADDSLVPDDCCSLPDGFPGQACSQ